jgi:hypothetical protein
MDQTKEYVSAAKQEMRSAIRLQKKVRRVSAGFYCVSHAI